MPNINYGSPTVSGNVQVSLTDPRLSQSLIKQGKTSATGITRTDTYTVPTGKFWIVKRLYTTRANSAAITIILNGYTLFAAATTEKEYILDNWKIDEGDEIQFQFSNGSSGNLNSEVYYEEYDKA